MRAIPDLHSRPIRFLIVAAFLGLLLPVALAFEDLPEGFDTSTLSEEQLEAIRELQSSSWYYLAELQLLIQERDTYRGSEAWDKATEAMYQEIREKRELIFEFKLT